MLDTSLAISDIMPYIFDVRLLIIPFISDSALHSGSSILEFLLPECNSLYCIKGIIN